MTEDELSTMLYAYAECAIFQSSLDWDDMTNTNPRPMDTTYNVT